ncbi:hypothetical protein ACS0TY_008559 [Phlomoides rotata]
MAVGSGSASEKNGRVKSPLPLQKKEMNSQENAVSSSHLKRNKSPGIRVVGGRIYDPVNGKTCHQCRQKTRDFVAACKNLSNKKPCPIMYCHKCLLNRYGEKAEEVDASGVWSCPKCRGICNCSICMKKRGHQPTGLLITTAKATGYSSVSEMLLKGGEGSNQEKVEPDMVASPKKDAAASPKKQGKENSLDEVDANLPQVDKKSKKVHKGVNDMHNCDMKSKKMKRVRLEETSSHDDEKKPKKTKKDELVKEDNKRTDATLTRRTSPRKSSVCHKITNEEAHVIKKDEANASNDKIVNHQIADLYAEISLPMGTELNSVSKIDLHTDDVGSALQLLEFCAVFHKILGVKKGQGEYVLQDLMQGRTGRRAKYSATAQFHILLLSILQKEQRAEPEVLSPSNVKSSWFHALKKYFSESQSALKVQCLNSFEKASDYETLKASEKLGLLNVLCDEVLATEKVRTWMEDQNTKLAEKVKEAKLKVSAARDTEKSLKQKMRDDLAKAIIAKHGKPLSISEHEAIVSQIKHETEEAHVKLLESQGMLLENVRSCDAVRIEPVFVGRGGNVYWKLRCSGNSDVLRQSKLYSISVYRTFCSLLLAILYYE